MGSIITETVDMISTLLLTSKPLADIEFVAEYPPVQKENPLHKTTVSIGLDSSEITANEEVKGQFRIRLRIRLDIHTPITSSGQVCFETYVRMMQEIVPYTSFVKGFGNEAVTFDRSTATLNMKTWADCELLSMLP